MTIHIKLSRLLKTITIKPLKDILFFRDAKTQLAAQVINHKTHHKTLNFLKPNDTKFQTKATYITAQSLIQLLPPTYQKLICF